MNRPCWTLVVLWVLTACGVEPTPDGATPSDIPTPHPIEPDKATDAVLDAIGSWSGSRCPARDYQRILEFKDSGRFVATDLVAPCPAGAQCIWSGIVVREGKWRNRGTALIELLPDDTDPHQPARPLPGAVALDTQTGELYEAVPGEPSPCRYQRTATDHP